MTEPYPIPAARHRVEIVDRRSRFIATIGCTSTTDEARAFIDGVRREMPDATHHVYAFRVGFGATETSGMSDDGEPAGTAGRPAMAVVRGSGLGDVCVVVTRYFGGTKLGTGGLVRAYTAAAQRAVQEVPRAVREERRLVALRTPYALYEPLLRIAEEHQAEVVATDFGPDVVLRLDLAERRMDAFAAAVAEVTSGSVEIEPARAT